MRERGGVLKQIFEFDPLKHTFRCNRMQMSMSEMFHQLTFPTLVSKDNRCQIHQINGRTASNATKNQNGKERPMGERKFELKLRGKLNQSLVISGLVLR